MNFETESQHLRSERTSASERTTASTLFDRTQWAVHAVIAALGLILMSPVIVVFAVAIKLTSPGPVFYRGARVGSRGATFTIYKFRTLAQGAEGQIGARILSDEDREQLSTRLGRFLKKSKLDELPQLWNVVRGEMRLVGPRPLRPIFLDKFDAEIPNYMARFSVPPGMTGIAQVRGGYYTTPRDKLRYDLSYVRNRSLPLDLKLVLFTLIKIVDRWLQMGLILLFLFLFVSFVPKTVRSSLVVSFFGIEMNILYLLIIGAAALTLSRKDFENFRVHRGPLNAAVASFVLVAIVSALFSDDPYQTLRGAGYYVVTGFLVAFMIVNTMAIEGFATLTLRVIALTPVFMSVLGLGELLVLNEGAAAFAAADILPKMSERFPRMTGLFGGPMPLAVYLVLGLPLVFAEVSRSQTQRERDFWIVCATVSVIGVLFTQTRVGFLALLVTGGFFIARRSTQALSFSAIVVLLVVTLASLGLPRFSPSRVTEDVGEWMRESAPILRSVPAREWLVGGKARTGEWLESPVTAEAARQEPRDIANMHVTLAWEYGVLAWAIVMWLILSALAAMKRAHDRLQDERLKVLLWAIMSCVVGFLVSMLGMNTFHNLTLQIFFWSLVGIGLGIANDAQKKKVNLIWRFGDAGD